MKTDEDNACLDDQLGSNNLREGVKLTYLLPGTPGTQHYLLQNFLSARCQAERRGYYTSNIIIIVIIVSWRHFDGCFYWQPLQHVVWPPKRKIRNSY